MVCACVRATAPTHAHVRGCCGGGAGNDLVLVNTESQNVVNGFFLGGSLYLAPRSMSEVHCALDPPGARARGPPAYPRVALKGRERDIHCGQ